MKTVLDVKGLTVEFRTKDFLVSAVNSISFSIDEGKTLALVGESGSGKTVTALSILKLLPYQIASHSQGSSIKVNGREIMEMNPSEIRSVRGDLVSMIFQEPMASFAPALTIGYQMVEQLLIHTSMSKKAAATLSVEMLERVGISDAGQRFHQYAFELSGGMRQGQ